MSENIILLFQKSFLPYLTYLRYLAHFLPKECPKNQVINYLARPKSIKSYYWPRDWLATSLGLQDIEFLYFNIYNL